MPRWTCFDVLGHGAGCAGGLGARGGYGAVMTDGTRELLAAMLEWTFAMGADAAVAEEATDWLAEGRGPPGSGFDFAEDEPAAVPAPAPNNAFATGAFRTAGFRTGGKSTRSRDGCAGAEVCARSSGCGCWSGAGGGAECRKP